MTLSQSNCSWCLRSEPCQGPTLAAAWLEGLPGIPWAPLQPGAALPKEYKPAVSHHNWRSALKFLPFLCIAFAQVMLIAGQSTEISACGSWPLSSQGQRNITNVWFPTVAKLMHQAAALAVLQTHVHQQASLGTHAGPELAWKKRR